MGKGTKPMKKALLGFEAISGVALAAVVILTMLQAVLRSFFNTGLSWTNESLFLSQIALVYLIVPVLFAERENIRVDVFVHLLPKKTWNLCWIVIETICLVFTVIFFVSITQFLQKTWNNTTAIMGIPNYIFYGAIWIGMLASNVCLVINIILSILGKKEAE